MNCHQCGACCIEISISSPIPDMPDGKPAGVRCVHLRNDNLCGIFNDPRRPAVCASFPAMPDVCGTSRAEAVTFIRLMEIATRP